MSDSQNLPNMSTNVTKQVSYPTILKWQIVYDPASGVNSDQWWCITQSEGGSISLSGWGLAQILPRWGLGWYWWRWKGMIWHICTARFMIMQEEKSNLAKDFVQQNKCLHIWCKKLANQSVLCVRWTLDKINWTKQQIANWHALFFWVMMIMKWSLGSSSKGRRHIWEKRIFWH